MRRLSKLLVMAGLALIGLLSGADMSEAADQVVSDCGDDGGPNQLRAKLSAAQNSGGGTITFTCGPNIVLNPARGYLPMITSTITINGGGITLSASSGMRHFNIYPGGTLNLNDLTLTKGYEDRDGGSIYNDYGGTLNINSSRFTQNETTANGSGAIFTLGALHIINSEFDNNKAANGSALMLFHSGAVTTISGSNFHDNQVLNTVNGFGGAIMVFDGASATISSSSLNSNHGLQGGAIYVWGAATLTLNNSTLTGNTATHGGGIFNVGTAILTGVSLSGNEASGSGGAIYSTATLTVTNTTVSGNKSTGIGFGGGGLFLWDGVATLTNSTVSGNQAAGNGGGIANDALTRLNNVTLNANQAGSYGGGIQSRDALTLTNVTLSNNIAGPLGGGIYNYNSDLWATNSTFSGNSATGRGGGFMNEDGYAYLSNLTFRGNVAPDGGGYYSRSSVETVKNTLFAKGANGDNCYLVDGGGFNLSDDASCAFGVGRDNVPNLNLGPLTNNGGFTRTHMPSVGSAAIDQAQCTDVFGQPVVTDQRGGARPHGLACDVGAIETGVILPFLWLPVIRR